MPDRQSDERPRDSMPALAQLVAPSEVAFAVALQAEELDPDDPTWELLPVQAVHFALEAEFDRHAAQVVGIRGPKLGEWVEYKLMCGIWVSDQVSCVLGRALILYLRSPVMSGLLPRMVAGVLQGSPPLRRPPESPPIVH